MHAHRRQLLIGLPALLVMGLQPLTGHAANTPDERPWPNGQARFRVSWQATSGKRQQQIWLLQRSAQAISWIKGEHTEDLWRRDASGIRLARVMRAERHVLRYAAGELAALQVQIDWDALACLLSPKELAALAPWPARRGWRQGQLDGEAVTVHWDAQAALPWRLTRRSGKGQVQFERLAWVPGSPPATWPEPGAGTNDFTQLDAADFGDMADNLAVQRARMLDERAGWRHPHEHAP